MLGGGFKMNVKAAPAATKKPGYGLIKPVKGYDVEDDDTTSMNEALERDRKDREKKQKKIMRETEAVLGQDPTAFDYDGVYDAIQRQRDLDKKAKETERSIQKKAPKYIKAIMKTAEERKIEQDIIYARMQNKQFEKEKKEFGDTEKFITAAYKEKLIKEKRWLEQEKKREEEERRNDVTKKSDLTGFFVNLLNNNVSMGFVREVPPEKAEEEEKRKQEEEARKSAAEAEGLSTTDATPITPVKMDEETRRKKLQEEEEEYRRRRIEEEKRLRKKEEEERLKEEQRKKEEEEKRLKKYQRKNDESSVSDARARYLARKAALQEKIEKQMKEED